MPAFARDVGLSITPNLFNALEPLSSVVEGEGRGTLHILYAPWCHAVPPFYADTRPFLSAMRLRWIPFSGGQIEGKIGTENILESLDPAQVPLNFPVIGSPALKSRKTPLSDAQDVKVAVFEKALIMETARQIYIPTMFYRMIDDRYRIIRGSIDASDLGYIAKVIA
jgi:hypothetical protein